MNTDAGTTESFSTAIKTIVAIFVLANRWSAATCLDRFAVNRNDDPRRTENYGVTLLCWFAHSISRRTGFPASMASSIGLSRAAYTA
jgi:hypothetical protein